MNKYLSTEDIKSFFLLWLYASFGKKNRVFFSLRETSENQLVIMAMSLK